MSDFTVDLAKWDKIINNIEDIGGSDLNKACNRISGVRNDLVVTDVGAVLDAIMNNIAKEQTYADTLATVLGQIKKKYSDTEDEISGIVSNEGSSDADDHSGQEPAEPGHWWDKLDTDIKKMILDIWTSFGEGGTGFLGIPVALIKALLDGKFSLKDAGALIKATGKSLSTWIKNIDGVTDWEKFWGLSQFKTLALDESAGWVKNMEKTFGDTFWDKFGIKDVDATTGVKKFSGTKIAGWALSLIANGFSNAEEYGTIMNKRAVAETISETLIDVGKGALIASGIAAGCAAAGVAAPAIAVAAGAVVISLGADYIGKAITGDPSFSITENLSDFILDSGEKAMEVAGDFLSDLGKKASGAVDYAKNTVASWTSKISKKGLSYSIA